MVTCIVQCIGTNKKRMHLGRRVFEEIPAKPRTENSNFSYSQIYLQNRTKNILHIYCYFVTDKYAIHYICRPFHPYKHSWIQFINIRTCGNFLEETCFLLSYHLNVENMENLSQTILWHVRCLLLLLLDDLRMNFLRCGSSKIEILHS